MTIALAYDPSTQRGDLVQDKQLALDEGLETAVIISLFTDQRSAATDDPANERGWWADAFPEVDDDEIGSKIWTLKRAKLTPDTLARTEEAAIAALQWLVDDGVASSVSVETEATEIQELGGELGVAVRVLIERPDEVAPRFDRTWKVTIGAL